jgi:TRAP-type C4-dicarboxylate transport system substrate-binding protein
MTPEVLVMSLKAWNGLSDGDRQIFRQAALESSRFMHEKWKALEARSRAAAEAAGVTVTTDFDRASFAAATAGIYAKAMQDPVTADLIQRIRQTE